MQELYVDTPAGLLELCAQLRGRPVLAIDTEFMREKTYYAQLCLVQIAAEDIVACVDPLALPDINPLLDLLYDPGVIKVMHAARQDLEIFFDLRGELPRPVFDTQIAATVLGYSDQIGYANLVQQMLGVNLDKTATRTDWSQRPLSPQQLHYAADDVRYLFQVYQHQQQSLAASGRLAWLQADFDELTALDNYAIEPQRLWKKVRGTQKLKGAQLAVLQALAAWREERARKANRPRRWILSDELLSDIARYCPQDSAALEHVRGIEPGFVGRNGAAVLELIATARQSDPATWPVLPGGRRLTLVQEALVDVLMAVLRLRGGEHDVSPALLASRKDLEEVVQGETEVPVLHGWRGAIAGQDLQAILAGRSIIRVIDDRLSIEALA